jgi:hypothetical protein
MNDSADDCNALCTTCRPFDSWDQRDKAYNIFCHSLVVKLNEEGSSMRQEFDVDYPKKDHKDLLIFATLKWRALLPQHNECVALLKNTAQGAYETYPIDVPSWINSG